MRIRDALVVVLVAVVFGLGLSMKVRLVETLSGLSIDSLFWLRYQMYGQRHDPATSPSVVIALDEETWRSPEFNDVPEVLWPPKIAPVINAVLAGGAKVIGFDIIWPTSVQNTIPGIERDYLLALRAGASAGKIVLSRVEHGLLPIAPSRPQSIAVSNQKNIRSVNLFNDPDDIIRRIPVAFNAENVDGTIRNDTSMSVELAARAMGMQPQVGPDNTLTLGDYKVPDNFLINFDYGNDAPTYSLVDMYECAEKGEEGAAYFREHFAGKVVLIGYVRDIEDRKIAGKRFITGDEHFSTVPRCATTPKIDFIRTGVHRLDIPGVYIHTSAVNTLLRHEVLHELTPGTRWIPSVLVSIVVGLGAMLLGPVAAGLSFAAAAAGWTLAATFALHSDWALPFIQVILAAGLTAATLFGYRFGIADRDKRMLRRNFSFYLAPAVIDRMEERPPELGGEQRTVTIFFSDLANFTTLSEGVTPNELVALINNYFSAMTDIVEAHGGYVDKYIGDAIVAMFGAPLTDPDHALHAVEAALACCQRLAQLNAESQTFLGRRLAMRIGINTGDALVGNIGSRRRFNYTVMGDTVNVASRLEGLNKQYGTTILAAESTVAAIGPTLAFRRIGRVSVKGRAQQVDVFTPEDAAMLANAAPEPADLALK